MHSIQEIKNLSKELSKIVLEPGKRDELWGLIEQRIDKAEIQQKVATKHTASRRKFAWAQVGAAFVGCAVSAILVAGIFHSYNHVQANKETAIVKTAYSVFVAPKNMTKSFQITSNDGKLSVLGYVSPGTSNMYAQLLYVVTNDTGTTPRVLYHLGDLNDLISRDEIFWFGQSQRQYLALLQNVSSGGRLVLQEFSNLNPGAWTVKSQESYVMPSSEIYKLDGQHLLFASRIVGAQVPIEYTLSSTGIKQATVSDPFPKAREVPVSTSITIYVSGTPNAKGGTDFQITGDVSLVHMHLGQQLVIRLVYNTHTKLPLEFRLYSDNGDPGPGSLAKLDPSPYTNAIVYTMVNTAQHGSIVVVPQITGADTSQNKFLKIRIIVQR